MQPGILELDTVETRDELQRGFIREVPSRFPCRDGGTSVYASVG
jgi:hypothetical protein